MGIKTVFTGMYRWANLILFAIILVTVASCSRRQGDDADPRKRIMDYISQSFAVRDITDRDILLEHLTGDAKYRLAAWSDDQFRAVFMESKRRFVNVKFHEVKKVSENRYDITYDMIYIDEGKTGDQPDSSARDGLAKVTQRKLAQIISDRGKWMITDIRSIKELVEYMGEMSLP
jgi:hypothetical protein